MNISNRVLRGGSWNNTPRICRTASRYFYWPPFRYYDLGFRLTL